MQNVRKSSSSLHAQNSISSTVQLQWRNHGEKRPGKNFPKYKFK